MDNDAEVLKHFGGVMANNLNTTLKIDDDIQDSERMSFCHSPYVDINSISSFKLPKNSTLNIMTINIQSISAKFNSLVAFLSILNENKLSIDVLNLQETWLSESWLSDPDNLNLFQIPGYKLIPQGKICCAHGGLFTYVRDIYKATERPLYKKSKLYEGLFIDITSDFLNGKVTVGNDKNQ